MFSVVIPVFNHERYLAQCVLPAAADPLVSEVLLLDDGSSDESYRLVRQLCGGALRKVRDVTPSPCINRGAHVALNDLVAHASCEWIAVLNSDDRFLANRFALVERSLRREDCGLVFGSLVVMDGAGNQLGRKRGPFDPQLPFPAAFDVAGMAGAGNWAELLSHQNLVATTSNILFRKSLFHAIGGFGPYRYIHDWDFVLRASLTGGVMYLPHPLTAYRIHAANTIKENSRNVDIEVGEMFARIRTDFPELARNRLFQIGLSENPYLRPPAPKLLSVVTPLGESGALYAAALAAHVANVEIIETQAPAPVAIRKELHAYEKQAAPPPPPVPSGLYVYAPAQMLHALHPIHMQNAVLALTFQDLDFIVVSNSLAEPPLIGVGALRNHVVFRGSESAAFLNGAPPSRPLAGRILRLPPVSLPAIDGAALPHGSIASAACVRDVPVLNTLRCFQETPKPIVFILPAMFAVGGVERLVIDMMRQLRDRYDFVLVTTERLSERQGSLHGQTEGIALGFYDLAELAPPALFLPMLQRLREVYRPALVWIPNGAPWQCDNAAGIRQVFAGIPIVDQQAYDTEAGWIARYADPGIQSYDRFIAINTRIQDTFIRKYGIHPAKIDMIYHSVNLDMVGALERSPEERRAYRAKYGLPSSGRIFGWIGRLTRQKRPLEFLQFAQRAAAQHNDLHFVMIGNGELAEECDAFIAGHRLTAVTPVRFSNSMGELFAVMSGLLSTSEYEGLPISMLEALSMGVPIFSTDVGDVGVVLDRYGTGQVTAAHWNLDRYLEAFAVWLAGLPRWQARTQEAAPLIRARFAGPSVAREYDQCWRRAIAELASSTTNHDITAGFCSGNSVKP
jgi:glycosyltransferase involved in cell wall biosynthesis